MSDDNFPFTKKEYFKLDKHYGDKFFSDMAKKSSTVRFVYYTWLLRQQSVRHNAIVAVVISLFALIAGITFVTTESLTNLGSALFLAIWAVYFLGMTEVAQARRDFSTIQVLEAIKAYQNGIIEDKE